MDTGIKGKKSIVVTENLTARVMGSGELDVFATPAMVALMEETAWRSVSDQLEEGQGTVGVSLDIKHLAATPLGMTVTCESTLVEVDRRRLVFELQVSDGVDVVGTGRHERFVVDNARFQEKAEKKGH